MKNKLDELLTIATIVFYCKSENTAVQAIEELREAAGKDGTIEIELVTILFCAELLQTKKLAKDKQDQITACNEIIACAKRIKDMDLKTSIVETKPIKGDIN